MTEYNLILVILPRAWPALTCHAPLPHVLPATLCTALASIPSTAIRGRHTTLPPQPTTPNASLCNKHYAVTPIAAGHDHLVRSTNAARQKKQAPASPPLHSLRSLDRLMAGLSAAWTRLVGCLCHAWLSQAAAAGRMHGCSRLQQVCLQHGPTHCCPCHAWRHPSTFCAGIPRRTTGRGACLVC